MHGMGGHRSGWGTLTAGYNLALEVVPGQVKYPEDSIVQKDQQEHEEEVTSEAKGLQHIKKLLPSR